MIIGWVFFFFNWRWVPSRLFRVLCECLGFWWLWGRSTPWWRLEFVGAILAGFLEWCGCSFFWWGRSLSTWRRVVCGLGHWRGGWEPCWSPWLSGRCCFSGDGRFAWNSHWGWLSWVVGRSGASVSANGDCSLRDTARQAYGVCGRSRWVVWQCLLPTSRLCCWGSCCDTTGHHVVPTTSNSRTLAVESGGHHLHVRT